MQVYMSSQVFDGPEKGRDNSVYRAERQKAMYAALQPVLSKAFSWKPPSLDLPTPLDMRCTQNAGHNAILPGQEPAEAQQAPVRGTAAPRVSSPEVLVEDGEPMRVVKAGPRDATIPREFWATSVNVPWMDPRNELNRRPKERTVSAAGVKERPVPQASHVKGRRELSSEIFGQVRRTAMSTQAPQQEIRSTSVDPLLMDSTLDREAARPPQLGTTAYSRFANNLAVSSSSTLPRAPPPEARLKFTPEEDPATFARRRYERNFSELFGNEAGPSEPKNSRAELVKTEVCNYLDTRSEISARNVEHWRREIPDTARDAKEVEQDSNIFSQQRPQRSPAPSSRRPPQAINIDDDMTCRTARERKLQEIGSAQMSRGLGSPVRPRPAASPPPSRRMSPPRSFEQRALSPKAMKLAAMQSSIFS